MAVNFFSGLRRNLNFRIDSVKNSSKENNSSQRNNCIENKNPKFSSNPWSDMFIKQEKEPNPDNNNQEDLSPPGGSMVIVPQVRVFYIDKIIDPQFYKPEDYNIIRKVIRGWKSITVIVYNFIFKDPNGNFTK